MAEEEGRTNEFSLRTTTSCEVTSFIDPFPNKPRKRSQSCSSVLSNATSTSNGKFSLDELKVKIGEIRCSDNKNVLLRDANIVETINTESVSNIEPDVSRTISIKNRFNRVMTHDVQPYKNASFEKLNLCLEMLIALKEKGWKWPSPIQEKSIPLIMNGVNLIARSKNGTGKTGAFALALLNKVNVNKGVQVVILEPTRELALQTASVCISLAKYRTGLHVMVATGGTDLAEDIYRLNNEKEQVQVVVGSPIRILDLLYSKQIHREELVSFVCDEADKLLSDDFEVYIKRIMTMLPTTCQKVLVSATFPVSIKTFVTKYMENCEQCNLMNELTLKGVTQYYAYLKEGQKISCLKQLLESLDIKQSILFCNSAKRVELLSKQITDFGYSCYYIHSKMAEQSRNKVFLDFRAGCVTHLVCSDLMARGIDVPDVNVVINFDFPKFADTYLHRIGRCGRFGHLAVAINLITDFDKDHVLDIGKQLGSKIYPIPKVIDKCLYVASYQFNDQIALH